MPWFLSKQAFLYMDFISRFVDNVAFFIFYFLNVQSQEFYAICVDGALKRDQNYGQSLTQHSQDVKKL